ncbi:hypothetical protein [Permianibacter aggregans]|uniref:hypothetical protein n=1 Tax=Permianibacter aggregans TaxID=1510150 RepID=UPI00105C45DC|nr:hypothetical protein [Permianibacter aggregans]QGX40161.1 hypothetical protein E2H98_10960 [Permianibacter aggregans]
MNLSFNPIVIFTSSWPFPISHLKNIKWGIESEKIGSHSFEIEISVDSPFDIKEHGNYVEFHLMKKGVKFQHDDYPCNLIFSAVLDSPHDSPIEIDKVFPGVVKAIWSKGVQ